MSISVLPSNIGVVIDGRELALFRLNCHRTIVIRDLPYHFEDKHLSDLILPIVGNDKELVELCRIKYNVKNRKTLQVGFVMLQTEEIAKQVLARLEKFPRCCGRDIRSSFYSSTLPNIDDRSKGGNLRFTFDADFLKPRVTEELVREHFEAFYGEVSWICIRRHFFKQHHQDGFGFVSFTEKKIEDELKTFSVLQREKVVYHFTTAKEVDAINQTRRFDLQKRSESPRVSPTSHLESSSNIQSADSTFYSVCGNKPINVPQASPAPEMTPGVPLQQVYSFHGNYEGVPQNVSLQLYPGPPPPHPFQDFHHHHPMLQGIMMPVSMTPFVTFPPASHSYNPMANNFHPHGHPPLRQYLQNFPQQQSQQYGPYFQYTAAFNPNQVPYIFPPAVIGNHLSSAAVYASYPHGSASFDVNMHIRSPPVVAGNQHHQYPNQSFAHESNHVHVRPSQMPPKSENDLPNNHQFYGNLK